MRGLQEETKNGGIFLTIKHACICEESKEAREGWEAIQVKNPRTEESSTKWIKRYSAVEAFITKIEWRDTGQQYEQRYMSWKIYLDANGTKCVLDIPFESRVSSRFMKLAENIDYHRPVEFRAWKDQQSDGTAFFVGQRENETDEKSTSVPQKYTRDNPGDCPPPVQKFNGKWNFDNQTEYLHERMMNYVIPAVEAAQSIRMDSSGYTAPVEDDGIDNDKVMAGVVADARGVDDEEIPF